ncbi:hypothetical protein EUGRSUZ_L01419 [Eucalyptus grandis]|uniref:catalase n=1 Tax=Eucalyptus grandis TaxID=71139 RepID=A0A058ZVF1_EUCGR|nr:hypothetical protein EUGRSUZ_L01419 [Eucalyptus grandis]
MASEVTSPLASRQQSFRVKAYWSFLAFHPCTSFCCWCVAISMCIGRNYSSVVHARGACAKGFFEVTHDISHLTRADFLQAPGVQTPVTVRFSILIHERGGPETLRDPRGSRVNFYTRGEGRFGSRHECAGNFDLVGNNFPIFFICDGMKFPDMVHALRPKPKSRFQENWRILDFFFHHPESLRLFTFLFDDIGSAQDYRHMQGSGVNTYTLINKARKAHHPCNSGFYDSIAAGNYPEWKLFVQILDPDHEDKFDFGPLDGAKTWPEDILPLMPVGRLVLNRNIDNFFAENEQLAFCPSIVVPGVYYSDLDDKLLPPPPFLSPPILINYFPSRYDPVCHGERYPIPPAMLTGKHEKINALSNPRVTHEIRNLWTSYWSQADKSSGQKLASRLNVQPSI